MGGGASGPREPVRVTSWNARSLVTHDTGVGRPTPATAHSTSMSGMLGGATGASVRTRGASAWERRHTAATVVVDLVAVVLVVVLGQVLGLGSTIPRFGDVSPGVGV